MVIPIACARAQKEGDVDMAEVINMLDWKKSRMAKATATIERNADLVDDDGNYLGSAEPIFSLVQTDELWGEWLTYRSTD